MVSLKLKLTLMLGLVAGLFLTQGREPQSAAVLFGTWILVCLAAELLWHPARDDTSVISMAPAAQLAAIVVLPFPWGVPLVTLTGFAGARWFQRLGWKEAVVRALVVLVSGLLVVALLQMTWWKSGLFRVVDVLREPEQFLRLLLAGVGLLVSQQVLSAWSTSRVRRTSWFRSWKLAYGDTTDLVSTTALLTVSVLLLLCYQAIGLRGILLCVMPILFIRDGSRRNIELKAAQTVLIERERLSARGEMAAEIGHELNNYLAAISGRAQLALRRLDREEPAFQDDAVAVRDLSTRMSELARGLMDIANRGRGDMSHSLNDIVMNTVDFVAPQPRFRGLRFQVSAAPEDPSARFEPSQIQQALILLLGREAAVASPVIRSLEIKTLPAREDGSVGIEIEIPGPAMGADEPLVQVARILKRQKGELEQWRHNGRGGYRLILPAAA